jgi:hypothetical protein
MKTRGRVGAVGRAESPGAVAGHHESAIRKPGGLGQLRRPGDGGIDDRATSGLGGNPEGCRDQ